MFPFKAGRIYTVEKISTYSAQPIHSELLTQAQLFLLQHSQEVPFFGLYHNRYIISENPMSADNGKKSSWQVQCTVRYMTSGSLP